MEVRESMKKILLVCSSGMSTSMLVRAMQKVADTEGYDVKIESAGIAGIEDLLKDADAVLAGPQIRHRFDSLKEMASALGKPAELVPQHVYGLMDGKAAIELVKKMLG